jgi:indolepyruvate ferredoxin oxidoreductase beta subunit
MTQMILCGRGGQGIVFLTRLLGDIATQKGLNVISSETHGMAVRGDL